mmetsp:Transcript_23333/g.69313  ORF Transcript_23333/g.69313 Transcript_23333/m.69313 type:complete len:257 (-) Transcript_23333:424-1194(-)
MDSYHDSAMQLNAQHDAWMQQQMNEHAYQAIQAQAGGMAPPVHAMGYRDAYDPGMAAQHAQHAGQQHPGELPAFRNVEPLSRDDRDAMRSGGAALEKMRMRQKGVAVVDNPIGALPGSPAYADEQARFQRDYAAVSYQERQKMQERQQQLYEAKRADMYHRDCARWERENQQFEAHEALLASKRGDGSGAARNASAQHYNILTLGYHQSPAGEQLRQVDNHKRAQIETRSQNLFAHDHSVSHNIINGAPLHYPGRH